MTPEPLALLDGYPLVRTRALSEATEQIGRVFSPHQLLMRDSARSLDVRHNQVRLRDVSLNTLTYGADVVIDPGERGDFYMVQLPLAGSAVLESGREVVRMDCDVLGVLQPRARCRMFWSGDCTMLLIRVPRAVVDERAQRGTGQAHPRFALSRNRRDPEVSAWWKAALDLTGNLDRFGEQWLRHPAAYAAMEEFLLSAFTSMLGGRDAAGDVGRGETRCLRRAKEYIRAHLNSALFLSDIARHACVSARTLEVAFKRAGEEPPLAYARRLRLEAAHRILQAATRDGRPANITQVALEHGFVHLGRFAAQYRQLFGCTPSQTSRMH